MTRIVRTYRMLLASFSCMSLGSTTLQGILSTVVVCTSLKSLLNLLSTNSNIETCRRVFLRALTTASSLSNACIQWETPSDRTVESLQKLYPELAPSFKVCRYKL
ncbi:hypothetical protein DER45DRAFT_401013 [Fusarium avenaceum]|nr:hypothetical protein DER45DRAFT_401013 [Fusarium avenaceum]